MTKTFHKLYIASLTLFVLFVGTYLTYTGIAYYSTGLEERFFTTAMRT